MHTIYFKCEFCFRVLRSIEVFEVCVRVIFSRFISKFWGSSVVSVTSSKSLADAGQPLQGAGCILSILNASSAFECCVRFKFLKFVFEFYFRVLGPSCAFECRFRHLEKSLADAVTFDPAGCISIYMYIYV